MANKYVKLDDIIDTLEREWGYEGMREDLEKLPTADVVPRSEVEKWYHEYHVIKEELKQEKMYHRETEKLADKYCAEIQTARIELEGMRGAANSFKMHYNNLAKEIFDEIEKCHFHIANDFDAIRYAELKKKHTEVRP